MSPRNDASVGPERTGASPSLRVFISYSRTDADFADEIAAGLEFAGAWQVEIDRKGVHEGEDWKARLGAMIASADTIVFILSPASAQSSVCAWEIEEAARLSKRILPVLAAPLGEVSAPPRLAALNYVRFDPQDDGRPRSFMAGLAGLQRALDTDLGWLREHTRLLTRALEWDVAGRPEDRLLVGESIRQAKAWLDSAPTGAPPPTALHRDYLQASEKAAEARESAERQRAERLQSLVSRTRRLLVAATAAAVVAIGAGAWAYVSYQNAKEQEQLAKAQERLAIENGRQAEEARSKAEQSKAILQDAGMRVLETALEAETREVRQTMLPILLNFYSNKGEVVSRDFSRLMQYFIGEQVSCNLPIDGVLGPESRACFEAWVKAGSVKEPADSGVKDP